VKTAPDVVVVGAGAVGMTTALELARAGANATVAERGVDPGAGCSGGSAGLINGSHAAPLATPESLRAGLGWLLRRGSPLSIRPSVRLIPWLARFVRAGLARDRVAATTEVLSALARAGHALHEELAQEGLPTGYERRGILYAYDGAPALESGWKQTRELAGHGLRVERLSTTEAKSLVPALKPWSCGRDLLPG
jgi:D-amino-acid dehydrogenase